MTEKQQNIEKIQPADIAEELQESYLDYAMSVIVSRALPDARDGLKPVQRRILYTMWENGLRPGSKFRKSAAVVGEVLKSLHPHGDISVYDALVRMTQDFSLRYPLIEGQGNFGCFTKDTKIKLTNGKNLSFEELIKEHKKGIKNYTYTVNLSGLIEIAQIKHPRLTKKNAEIIKVSLDNGAEIKCTPNHLFMLRNGVYKEAKDLKPNDSLMPIYQRLSTKTDRLNREGYALIYQNKKKEWVVLEKYKNLNQELYEQERNKIYNYGKATSWKTGIKKYYKEDEKILLQNIIQNHKVKKIEFHSLKEDVYDLTIDGTHNFALAAGIFVHNSVDGDSAAAYRYTEARLAKISEELLTDIEKETVNWAPNYDASTEEPKVLPAKLPNLLLNGSMGIAVGMATNIPPHNLGEVADAIIFLAEHPDSHPKDLTQFVKGPDFPTGGIIYDKKSIEEAYVSGRGAITTRAVAEIEERKNGQFDIIITEIPYQVNKAELITRIAELVQEKKIEGIRDLRDESDREGMRIVVELKNDAPPQKILNQLYQYTDLQKDFYLNMLALAEGIRPQVMSLKDVLEAYLEHRKTVIRRRTEYDLKKAEERAHILEGLVKALNVIDKIIAAIKASANKEEAHKNLVKKFKLSDLQTTAILEMKLQNLAALERKQLEAELKEKIKLIEELRLILKNPKKILDILKKEVVELKEKHADERRTKVIPSSLKEFREEDLTPKEETLITLSQSNYIKRLKPETFKVQRRGGKGLIGVELKEEDFVKHFMSANTHDNILFFTDQGRAFQTKVYEIPQATRTSKGKIIHNFLDIPAAETISAIIAYPNDAAENRFLMMLTKNGLIKKVELSAFAKVRRTGITAIKLKKGDALKSAKLTSKNEEAIITSAKGQAIRFKESDIRPQGRNAAGVRGIR
ncbi:MAG: DNA gyrase subunit A, partial [Patescibacteria group bacterium]